MRLSVVQSTQFSINATEKRKPLFGMKAFYISEACSSHKKQGDRMRIPFLSKEQKTVDEIEEYTELPMDEEEQKKISIVIEKLDGLSNVDRIMKQVREGRIVVVKIKELREQNLDELKHAISRMKTACSTLDGDIAGVGEDWVIVTPATARIAREGE